MEPINLKAFVVLMTVICLCVSQDRQGKRLSGYEYRFSKNGFTWSVAQDKCRLGAPNADLVSVLSRTQDNTIQADRPTHEYWIGIRTTDTGRWRWSDNSTISYTNWNETIDPEPSENNQCGYYAASEQGTWLYSQCDERRRFICETDIDECQEEPCDNNSTCVNSIGSYLCHCTQGFRGRHCQEDIDECQDAPCDNNSTCVNSIGSYLCQCTQGFRGTHCQEDINVCESNPCQNNSTCINEDDFYLCRCTRGFYGDHCTKVAKVGFKHTWWVVCVCVAGFLLITVIIVVILCRCCRRREMNVKKVNVENAGSRDNSEEFCADLATSLSQKSDDYYATVPSQLTNGVTARSTESKKQLLLQPPLCLEQSAYAREHYDSTRNVKPQNDAPSEPMYVNKPHLIDNSLKEQIKKTGKPDIKPRTVLYVNTPKLNGFQSNNGSQDVDENSWEDTYDVSNESALTDAHISGKSARKKGKQRDSDVYIYADKDAHPRVTYSSSPPACSIHEAGAMSPMYMPMGSTDNIFPQSNSQADSIYVNCKAKIH